MKAWSLGTALSLLSVCQSLSAGQGAESEVRKDEGEMVTLLHQLSSEEFEVREDAEKKLLLLGPAIGVPIKKWMSANRNDDPDFHSRIDRILQQLAECPLQQLKTTYLPSGFYCEQDKTAFLVTCPEEFTLFERMTWGGNYPPPP